jgi:hypothetical protein
MASDGDWDQAADGDWDPTTYDNAISDIHTFYDTNANLYTTVSLLIVVPIAIVLLSPMDHALIIHNTCCVNHIMYSFPEHYIFI